MFRFIGSLLIVLTFVNVSNAQLYLVHGIDGGELGVAPTNSYDLMLNGSCIVTGLNYQQI